MGQSRPLLVYFCYFLDTISILQIEKSLDGVLGIRTQGHRMVGTDETTELWRPPKQTIFYLVERSVPISFYQRSPVRWSNKSILSFLFNIFDAKFNNVDWSLVAQKHFLGASKGFQILSLIPILWNEEKLLSTLGQKTWENEALSLSLLITPSLSLSPYKSMSLHLRLAHTHTPMCRSFAKLLIICLFVFPKYLKVWWMTFLIFPLKK